MKCLIKKGMEVLDNEGTLWIVEEVLKPTKYDVYVLCSRADDTHIHEDNKTIPIIMYTFDYHNGGLYPNTEHNRAVFEKIVDRWEILREAKSFWAKDGD